MKRIIAISAATFLAVGLMTVPAQAQTVNAQPGISQASSNNKYTQRQRNQFWRLVRTYEPTVRVVGKRDTVSLGISTCNYLRAGGDMYGLAAILVTSDAGIAQDAIMAVMAAAPVVLCRDQRHKFE